MASGKEIWNPAAKEESDSNPIGRDRTAAGNPTAEKREEEMIAGVTTYKAEKTQDLSCCVKVSVSATQYNVLKLQVAFEKYCLKNDIGEVNNVHPLQEPGYILVEFQNKEAAEKFSKSEDVTLTVVDQKISLQVCKMEEQHSQQKANPTPLKKIKVHSEIDLGVLDPELRQKVKELIRSKKIQLTVCEDEKIKLDGSLEAVEEIFQALLTFQSQSAFQDEKSSSSHRKRHSDTDASQWLEEKRRECVEMEESMEWEQSDFEETSSNKKKPDSNHMNAKMSISCYDYVNNAFREEIDTILKNNHVYPVSEVLLTFKPVPGCKVLASVDKAQDAFTELFQNAVWNIETIKMPVTQAQSEAMKTAFCKLQKSHRRFTLSEDKGDLILTGPRQDLQQFQKKLQLAATGKQPAEFILEPDGKFLKDGIEVNSAIWKVLQQCVKEELENLKEKYGVELDAKPDSSKDPLTVIIRSKPGTFALAGHAYWAFIDLYQKTAINLFQIAVEDPKDVSPVSIFYQEIAVSHPNVIAKCNTEEFKLVGLQAKVMSLVREIQGYMKKKVFKAVPGTDPSTTGSWNVNGLAGGKAASDSNSTSLDLKWPGATAQHVEKEKERCPICLDSFQEKQTLRCNHSFCSRCWQQAKTVTPMCPICKAVYGMIEGNQPPGTMNWRFINHSLPGYSCPTIEIEYKFLSGVQSESHPHPGKHYEGTQRTAYLPDNKEGKHVLELLQRAFKQKLVFTVGPSRTSGRDNQVTWNDIHHKTNMIGGPQSYGYPDPEYLSRVKEELKAKGIE
ncbi:E3 ubiquitin-protein ligase DTX3L [Latimeria chalumnae]|uniref:E3 ubiquitin-protein ligase DTX3L n=1 Tax=Latimeria chalumnae TaxID=7897 RepID=UPI0003C130BA|nr:PREDICTED: E3 ubiquitin-protein ligase DTX3L-like [Latimeria chalumnae]XP_014341294.1 PREDICTED: E3 ubiquitin-protein ligase DTX3L-like [Latimeria chalumnae]|eukprot:XP_005991517.1 PREDICTED: E3 ubiquitin-protein ligase DTX3L-like [Latimeria chalumnae]